MKINLSNNDVIKVFCFLKFMYRFYDYILVYLKYRRSHYNIKVVHCLYIIISKLSI